MSGEESPSGLEERPQITHRRILAIALPIVLSNATIPLQGAIDTAVVGQMGAAAPIGAVGLGAVIVSSLYWIFGFLRMGTTALVAQASGGGDLSESGAVVSRGMMIALAGGVLLIALQALLFWVAFAISPASQEVESLARDYLSIRVWGAPAAIALFVLTGWLIGVEQTRGVLVLQIGMSLANIALNLWFVLGLGWGVKGVALATILAEWGALALGLWLCRPVWAGAAWRDWGRVFDRAKLRRLFVVNRDILLRNLIMTLSFTGFIFLSSGLGDVTLAANQVLMQFFSVTAFALDGFAFAAETLVGQAVGAEARADLRRATWLASLWSLVGAVLVSLSFWALGPWIIDLMATAPEVREAARVYLIWVILAPILSTMSFVFDGVYFGATWTRDMLIAMLQSVAVYVAALLLLGPWWGNHGLWAALMLFSVARAVTLYLRYGRLEASVGPPS